MEKTIIDGSIIGIYFGLFFIFWAMLMFYMSLKGRVRQISRDMDYMHEDIKEIQRNIWKLK